MSPFLPNVKCRNCGRKLLVQEDKKEPAEGLTTPSRVFRPVNLWIATWIGVGFSPATFILGGLFMDGFRNSSPAGVKLLFLVLNLLPWFWFWYEFYTAWRYVIRWAWRENVRVPIDSAGLVILLWFVPVVSLFWGPTFWGIASYLNKVLDSADCETPRANADLGPLYYCMMIGSVVLGGTALLLNGSGVFVIVGFFAILCSLSAVVSLLAFAYSLTKAINAAGPILGGLPKASRS